VLVLLLDQLQDPSLDRALLARVNGVFGSEARKLESSCRRESGRAHAGRCTSCGRPPGCCRGAAIGIALVNLAHVVGLTLMESVRYRGGFAKFFRYLSLIGTPLAVVVTFVLLMS
jgi:hypothetical protein